MDDPNSLLSSFGLTPNVALGALGLGYDALHGSQMPKGYNQFAAGAQQLGQQGQQLMAASTGGPLPPAATSLLNQQEQASQAASRSAYAGMGLTGSTMESQALAQVAQQRQATAFQMTRSMFDDGLKMIGMSQKDLSQIMQMSVAEDAAFGKAFGNFAAALAGAAAHD